MSKRRAGLRAILKDVERGPQRSPLYWWLVDHHDEVATAAGGGRIVWGPLLAKFAKLGLTNRDGKPLDSRIASDTWAQVRRDVNERRGRKAGNQGVKRHPSRLPADWRPTPVGTPALDRPERFDRLATPPPPHPSAAATDGNASPTPETADGLVPDEVVREKLAKLRRTLQHEDRWLGGTRRKE